MPEIPALPLWEILYLNGISLVLSGCLAAFLDGGFEADPRPGLPQPSDPYAEV